MVKGGIDMIDQNNEEKALGNICKCVKKSGKRFLLRLIAIKKEYYAFETIEGRTMRNIRENIVFIEPVV
jgi:hypothetical protein